MHASPNNLSEIANALAVAYLNFHASKSNRYELNTCMGFL